MDTPPAANARKSQPRARTSSGTVGEYLTSAGINVDPTLLQACAEAGDPQRTALYRKPRYLAVMLKTFARSVCRPSNDRSKMAMLNGRPGHDALGNIAGGSPTLVDTYALLLGLGLRESSGDFKEGADASVQGRRSSASIEAGAFQTSYDIHGCLKGNARVGLTSLEKSYANASREDCMMSDGDATVDIPDASKNGVAFQKALRNCPALAVEHAAITIRQCKQHYGPLQRREAKTFASCKPLLRSIAAQAASDPAMCDQVQYAGRGSNASHAVQDAADDQTAR
jgi:hypothetical protein